MCFCLKKRKKRKRMKCHLNAHTQVWPITYLELYANDVHLCECDWSVFGDVFSIFACEHSAVTSIHLLRDLLSIQGNKKDRSDDPGDLFFFVFFLINLKQYKPKTMFTLRNSHWVFYFLESILRYPSSAPSCLHFLVSDIFWNTEAQLRHFWQCLDMHNL